MMTYSYGALDANEESIELSSQNGREQQTWTPSRQKEADTKPTVQVSSLHFSQALI
jgi:hypothetical protein